MAYDPDLAEKVRGYLINVPNIEVKEQKMIGGLAFMVNGKMCINVSEDQLMCRFDPALAEEIEEKAGYLPMIMNGRELKGYCYVEPAGYKSNQDFEFWMNLCLDFNDRAKASKKRKKS
jgi:TfoX/Sxy family transcriptional regulator of competence genes